MTLAKIFCVGIFSAATAMPLVAENPRLTFQDADQPSSAAQTQDAPSTAPPAKPTTATPDAEKTPAIQNTAPAPRRRHKKKAAPPNCIPSAPAPAATDPATAGTAPAPANPPTNCPPTKVIVRQGGTAEQKVQLAGGDDKTSHERDPATQMLSVTEQNLKKIAGLKLNPSQKDVVTQIRQFMDQSKAATAAGDPSRARTLAWKAQLLSEDLIKPPQ